MTKLLQSIVLTLLLVLPAQAYEAKIKRVNLGAVCQVEEAGLAAYDSAVDGSLKTQGPPLLAQMLCVPLVGRYFEVDDRVTVEVIAGPEVDPYGNLLVLIRVEGNPGTPDAGKVVYVMGWIPSESA